MDSSNSKIISMTSKSKVPEKHASDAQLLICSDMYLFCIKQVLFQLWGRTEYQPLLHQDLRPEQPATRSDLISVSTEAKKV